MQIVKKLKIKKIKSIMVFKLISFTYLVSNADLNCDAFDIWLDIVTRMDVKGKQKGMSTWFNARHGILSGSSYLEYSFVDEQSGEMLIMNCRIDMNKFLADNKLYPPIIQYAFDKFKSK